MAEDPHNGNESGSGKSFFSFDANDGTSSENGNSVGGVGGTIDPATVAAGNSDGEPGRKRRERSDKGKSRGARGAGAGTKASLDLSLVEFTLVGIHSILAAATKIPELELQQEEAKTLAVHIGNVAQYYPMMIDPKTQAWVALFIVAGGLYGTRFVAYNARLHAEKQSATAVQPATVTPFRAV